MTTTPLIRVLFLCTGNSARSILAEAVLNRLGDGRFEGLSAGSHPKGAVHPDALDLLARQGHSVEGLRSKSWDIFAGPDAPAIDIVITVCDNAAGEVCPIWPGHPATAHWGLPDPAAVDDPAARKAAFEDTYRALDDRIGALVALPVETLAPEVLKDRLDAVGRTMSTDTHEKA